MFDIYTNNESCPYCIKAKKFLELKNEDYNYHVIATDELINKFPTARTVPQITYGGKRIGGYDDLVDVYGDVINSTLYKPKERTVFNVDNTGYKTGEYPLFLGEDLGFVDTINTPYPIIDQLYQEQLAQIWNEFEIDLRQDRQDMINANPSTVALMVKTILWQHLADSIANRSITGVLLEHVTNSDLEGWYNCVALFETIHARTYSHIIKQTFVDPNGALKEGYEDLSVIKRAECIADAFNNVANLAPDASEEEKREKLYLAVIALYMLEGMNFMASFAITFGIAETGIFQGIGQDVTLICRDEMLHARGGKEIMKIEMAKYPNVFKKLKPQIQELFDAIIQGEMDWTDYLFSEGRQCIGITAPLIKEYVKYMAQPIGQVLGLDYETVEKNPLPYMDNYIDSSKVQVAAQELQLTSYLVNAVKAPVDMEGTLAKLREEYL